MGLFPKDTFVITHNEEIDIMFAEDSNLLGVYIALLRHRNSKTGQCNPSQDLIAQETNKNRKTVGKMIDDLNRIGVIRYDDDEKVGAGHSRNYRFPYVEKRLAKATNVRPFADKFVAAANNDSRRAVLVSLVNKRTPEEAKADVDAFWHEMHQRWNGIKSKLMVFDILDKLKMSQYKRLFDDYP